MIAKNLDKWLFLSWAILVLLALYLLRPVLLPFLISLVLAYLADPVADLFERLFGNRTFAVIIVFIGIFLSITAMVTLLVPVLAEQLNGAILKFPIVLNWFDEKIIYALDYFNLKTNKIVLLDFLNQATTDNLSSLAFSFQSVLVKIASSGLQLAGGLFYLLLVPIVTFYLLRDWDKILDKISFMIPTEMKPTVIILSMKIDKVLSEFFRGQLSVIFCLIIIYSLGLYLIGLDLWFLAASVAGLFSFIPYVGIVVGILVSLVGALIQLADQSVFLGIFLVFIIGQALESVVLSPLLVGDRVGLHPVAIIFAVMAGGELFGFFGVLAAVPMAAIGIVLIRHFFGFSKSEPEIVIKER